MSPLDAYFNYYFIYIYIFCFLIPRLLLMKWNNANVYLIQWRFYTIKFHKYRDRKTFVSLDLVSFYNRRGVNWVASPQTSNFLMKNNPRQSQNSKVSSKHKKSGKPNKKKKIRNQYFIPRLGEHKFRLKKESSIFSQEKLKLSNLNMTGFITEKHGRLS